MTVIALAGGPYACKKIRVKLNKQLKKGGKKARVGKGSMPGVVDKPGEMIEHVLREKPRAYFRGTPRRRLLPGRPDRRARELANFVGRLVRNDR